MVVLLFVAVGRRISDCGITETRYFGLLIGGNPGVRSPG